MSFSRKTRTAERFVVLGCGGFIGSHLLDALLADATNYVEGFDLAQRTSGRKDLLNQRVSRVAPSVTHGRLQTG